MILVGVSARGAGFSDTPTGAEIDEILAFTCSTWPERIFAVLGLKQHRHEIAPELA